TLKSNYYSTPSLVPPMPWIDTAAPKSPSIYNVTEDNSKSSDKGFTIYARANTSNETENVKSYVIYLSPSYAYLGALPTYIIPASDITDFQLNFLQSQIPSDWSG